ncbi:MAG TPA: 50S ribosomal protein L16 [Chitinivibrionales bacterium]|nr:50S ribosomal protein L16 [Chitinivibrionales bacterium]
MLAPKKVKWRKQQRGRMRGQATRCNSLAFGEYGLQAVQPGWVDSKQMEAARIAMARFLKRGGKIFIRVYPDKPYTKHPAESRMGKGKGIPEGWVAVVRPGTVMFEMAGVKADVAQKAIRLASQKLPIRSRLIEIEETIG